MLSIGVAQTRNSTDVHRNYESILGYLKKFENENVDLVLFPECSLSGCSAKMKTCTREFISDFLDSIQSWVNETGIHVVLPTAIVENEKVYNSAFWIRKGASEQLYKVGLTPSEIKFFSIPQNVPKKIIEVKDTKLAILICREAQDGPWTHFAKGEADAILWPGYWGWTEDDEWTANLTTGEPNIILENMKSWKIPLIQANFAFNDLEGYSGPGPTGRSVVVDANNILVHRGEYNQESGFIVNFQKVDGRLFISTNFKGGEDV